MAGKTYKQLTQVQKVFKASTEEKKIFFGNYEVFSSAHEVAYYIDAGNVVVLEIDDEDDIIANAPTATKAGWTFVGWRQDAQADPNVIHSLPATEDNMAVYAVFRQTVTVSLVGGDSLITNSSTRYYNNGNYRNPWIQLGYATKSGWTLVGYCINTQVISNPPYIAGTNYEFTQNTTLYAEFSQPVVVRVTIKGTMTTYSRTKLYNNGNYGYPSISVQNPWLDDANFNGYSTSATSTDIAISTLWPAHTFQQSTDLYAVWTYNSALLFEASPTQMDVSADRPKRLPVPKYDHSGDFTFNGIKYVTLSVTLTASVSVAGWSSQNNVWLHLGDASETLVLHGGRGSQQGQWEEGPCADGAEATVDVVTAQADNRVLYAIFDGDMAGDSWFHISRVYGNGRTLVY